MEKREPLVSVICPVFNAAKFLNTCIESIAKQTLHDIEIIMVDDGSTDGSSLILDEWARKDERIKVIHKSNEGIGKARNTGIDIASGKYIYFIDNDDEIKKDALSLMFQNAKETGSDLVIADHAKFYIPSNSIRELPFFQNNFVSEDLTLISVLKEMVLFSSLNPFCPLSYGQISTFCAPWNKLIKTSFIKENLIYFKNVQISEDRLFTFSLLSKIQKVSYLKQTTYIFKRHSDATSNRYRQDMIDLVNEYIKELEDAIGKYDCMKEMEQAYYASIISHVQLIYNNCFYAKENKTPLPKKLFEVRKLLKSEPYKTALKKAKLSYLGKSYEKNFTLLYRLRLNIIIQLFWYIMNRMKT